MFFNFHFFPAASIDWEFMTGLMENAIYGGRVDNTYDMRVLSSYLHQYFNSGVVTGQTGYTHQSGKKSLPIGHIPVSAKLQVKKRYFSMKIDNNILGFLGHYIFTARV